MQKKDVPETECILIRKNEKPLVVLYFHVNNSIADVVAIDNTSALLYIHSCINHFIENLVEKYSYYNRKQLLPASYCSHLSLLFYTG